MAEIRELADKAKAGVEAHPWLAVLGGVAALVGIYAFMTGGIGAAGGSGGGGMGASSGLGPPMYLGGGSGGAGLGGAFRRGLSGGGRHKQSGGTGGGGNGGGGGKGGGSKGPFAGLSRKQVALKAASYYTTPPHMRQWNAAGAGQGLTGFETSLKKTPGAIH